MKPKAETVNPQDMNQGKSSFNNVNKYSVNYGGFGNSTTRKVTNPNSKNGNKQLQTSYKFSQPMQQIQNTATSGLQNNLADLNTPYSQQLQNLDAGKNAAYNYMAETAKRQNLNAYNDLQARMSHNGLAGSTVLGGFAGQQAQNNYMQDLANRTSAIDSGQQYNMNNFNANGQTLQNLYSMASGQSALANSNAMTGMGSQDAMSLANAQMQNQQLSQNAQMRTQANQAGAANWGNLIGAGLSAGAMLGTGGMSGTNPIGGRK